MRSRTRPSENTNKERAWGDEATFDLSPHNLYHEVRMAAKKVLVSWQSLGEPERSRVVTFIGGRKEL